MDTDEHSDRQKGQGGVIERLFVYSVCTSFIMVSVCICVSAELVSLPPNRCIKKSDELDDL